MTDTAGEKSPFPGFPGFPPAEMLDKMWDMMRLTPFGAAFPGMQPGTAQGFGSPLTAMSDMMSPLMNVEELDKRITDMRAVEQWLKLNLNMLQSAIQALEVQRATLSTLRAFGAFAQASMQPSDAAGQAKSRRPRLRRGVHRRAPRRTLPRALGRDGRARPARRARSALTTSSPPRRPTRSRRARPRATTRTRHSIRAAGGICCNRSSTS